jgi:hypothetical protein
MKADDESFKQIPQLLVADGSRCSADGIELQQSNVSEAVDLDCGFREVVHRGAVTSWVFDATSGFTMR